MLNNRIEVRNEHASLRKPEENQGSWQGPQPIAGPNGVPPSKWICSNHHLHVILLKIQLLRKFCLLDLAQDRGEMSPMPSGGWDTLIDISTKAAARETRVISQQSQALFQKEEEGILDTQQ